MFWCRLNSRGVVKLEKKFNTVVKKQLESRGVSLLDRSWRWRRGTKTTSRNEARKPSR